MDQDLDGLTERDDGEVELVTGLSYTSDEPVRVRVTKRDQHYLLDDTGAAVRLTGEPDGWFETAAGLMAAHGMSMTREGAVLVRDVEGRDLQAVVLSVADTSLALYAALRETDLEVGFDSDTSVE